jgi:parvulin-like peptidyl-prolyl isomerase
VKSHLAWTWLVACGCAGQPVRDPQPPPVVEAQADPGARAAAAASLPLPVVDDLGVQILLPAADSTDAEIRRVGDVAIHKRDVYDRLVSTHLVLADNLIQQLEIDALIARQAQVLGVTIDEEVIADDVEEEVGRLRQQVDRELGAKMSFDRYLERQSGLDEGGYRQWLRLNLARKAYRDYVIRYLALREDRVQVRFIVHSDEKLLRDVAERVGEGADFATLAVRHSEDESRRDGGLLPPFARGYRHPAASVAFDLEPGKLSPVFTVRGESGVRHYLVYCVKRIAGRAVDFAAARAELDQEIAERALTQSEVLAAYDRLRELAGKPPGQR